MISLEGIPGLGSPIAKHAVPAINEKSVLVANKSLLATFFAGFLE